MAAALAKKADADDKQCRLSFGLKVAPPSTPSASSSMSRASSVMSGLSQQRRANQPISVDLTSHCGSLIGASSFCRASSADLDAYSQLGTSPSSSAEEELARTKRLLDQLVRVEVNDWMQHILQKVVEQSCLEGVKHRRMHYKPAEKVRVVDALKKIRKEMPTGDGDVASKQQLQKKLRAATGTKVQVQMVEKWETHCALRKRGRKNLREKSSINLCLLHSRRLMIKSKQLLWQTCAIAML